MSQRSWTPKPKMCDNGCGSEIVWNNNLKFFENTANHERHMCPNYTPRERRDDIKQTYQPQQRITGTTTYPVPGLQQKTAKEESMQAMHDENTELTKAYHKILEKQNELKERELDLLERQVKTQEWMSQAVNDQQADLPENLLSKGKKKDESI